MNNLKEYFNEKYGKPSKQISPIRIYNFTRNNLIKLFAEFKFIKGAEIGVKKGDFSDFMFQNIPELELICVDPWGRVRDDTRTKIVGNKDAEIYYQEVKKRFFSYNCNIIRDVSLEAVRNVEWESLDFVHIDGSHEFDHVMVDIIEWSRRVKFGGIVSGHDYYRFARAGVIQAVDLYTYMHGIYEWFVTDEPSPTWFWVKPPYRFAK